MTTTTHSRIVPHEFTESEALAEALAARLAGLLQKGIAERGEALLAVSGGNTPVRFFEALSKEKLDWDKVIVTLVDDRFVVPESERSNEGLAYRRLLKNEAAKAQFIPLYSPADSIQEAAGIANDRMAALPLPFDVVVLGMGNDGHTASFFPGGDRLAEATRTDTTRLVSTMSAEGAGEDRLTLTLPPIINARALFLHMEGNAKRAIFTEALNDGPADDLPIRYVLRSAPSPIQLYWAP
ncbi:MAG: 6-phosphogluconolactonase [Phyllobacterium sp.]